MKIVFKISDGSVDRLQIVKMYALLRVINEKGITN
jgi:hypothetical protein